MSAVTASVPSFILSSSSYSQVRCPTALLASSSSSSSSSSPSSSSSSPSSIISLPSEPGVTILIVGVVQYKEEAELFKFRKLIVLAACAVLATGVLLFIIKVFIVDIIIDCEIEKTILNVCQCLFQCACFCQARDSHLEDQEGGRKHESNLQDKTSLVILSSSSYHDNCSPYVIISFFFEIALWPSSGERAGWRRREQGDQWTRGSWRSRLWSMIVHFCWDPSLSIAACFVMIDNKSWQ